MDQQKQVIIKFEQRKIKLFGKCSLNTKGIIKIVGVKVERAHKIRLWGVTRDDSDRIKDKVSFG